MFAELLLAAQLPRMPRRESPPAPPPPASVALTLTTGAGVVRATVSPKQPQPARLPKGELKAGETPQLRWSVRNLDGKKPLRNLVVHVRLGREGEEAPVIESFLGTDLSASRSTSGSYNTAVAEPGDYLAEVELLDARGKRLLRCSVSLRVEP